MNRIRRNLCKTITIFAAAFVLIGALTPVSAAGQVSKPVKIEQLADGGFFVLTFQDKIHPSLPEFSFDIFALPVGRGANYQARRIVISETGTGNILQEISLLNVSRLVDYPGTSDKETMGFVIEDMNFDGYKDIRIVAFMPGGIRIPYVYWFWNNNENEKKFVKNADMEEVTSPVFDPVNKTIHSSAVRAGKKTYDIVYKLVDYVPVTKENYLKNLAQLEQMEADFKDKNKSEKKKAMTNCYKGWDEELNNILGHLTKELAPEKGEVLKTSQKNWLIEREKLAKAASAKEPDNSSLVYTYSLIQSTKNRTKELIDLFFGGEKRG